MLWLLVLSPAVFLIGRPHHFRQIFDLFFRKNIVLLSYRYAVMLSCCHTAMPLCCYDSISLCCYAVIPLCRYAVITVYRYAVMLSCCYAVIMSSCHAVFARDGFTAEAQNAACLLCASTVRRRRSLMLKGDGFDAAIAHLHLILQHFENVLFGCW